MQILRSGGFAKLPWKNGLGVSRVLASSPAGAGYDAVLWQVSTTEISADCPFSSLPGIDRRFMLLDGKGVDLACSDAATGHRQGYRVAAAFAPVEFRGDWKTDCRLLDGGVQVLNVMTRRGRVRAEIRVRRWTGALLCEQRPGETLLAVMLAGSGTIGAKSVGAKAAPLAAHDAVLLDAGSGEPCQIEANAAGARVALVRLARA